MRLDGAGGIALVVVFLSRHDLFNCVEPGSGGMWFLFLRTAGKEDMDMIVLDCPIPLKN